MAKYNLSATTSATNLAKTVANTSYGLLEYLHCMQRSMVEIPLAQLPKYKKLKRSLIHHLETYLEIYSNHQGFPNHTSSLIHHSQYYIYLLYGHL